MRIDVVCVMSQCDLAYDDLQAYRHTGSEVSQRHGVARGRKPLLEEGYAITGAFGVPDEARVVASALMSCYVEDVAGVAEELDLRPADSGANVLLLDPFDDLVFRRTRTEDGIVAVALSQCAVDLLTGSGREPAQGEALIDWKVASQAIHSFSELFGTARSPGCRMAARALTPMEPEATTAASAAALAQDLIRLAGLP